MKLARYRFSSALFLCLILLKCTLTTISDCIIHSVVSELTVLPEVNL